MIGENVIAFDCLESEKHSVVDLTDAALETSNQNLRQSLIRMRNQAEQDQKEIYHIAEQNGWYLSATKANPQAVSRLNNFLQQSYQMTGQMQTGNTGTQRSQQQGQYYQQPKQKRHQQQQHYQQSPPQYTKY